jgi:hypothetical protein
MYVAVDDVGWSGDLGGSGSLREFRLVCGRKSKCGLGKRGKVLADVASRGRWRDWVESPI